MGFDIYRIYTEAKARIEAKTYDERDEAIVALWQSSVTAVKDATAGVDTSRKQLAEASFAADIRESRAVMKPSHLQLVSKEVH